MLYSQYQRLMKLCMLCSVIIILPHGTTSYSAVFGTTRYGRSIPSHRTATSTQWIPASYGLPITNYKAPRISNQVPANYPGFYYEPFYNPYPQDYFDEYFYPQQDPLAYPLYYAPTRNSKYEPYQTFPYFYDDRRMRQPIRYELYNTDEDSYPLTDLQDQMLQEDAKDFENDGLMSTIDQDDWFENDLREQPDINNDNVNSAFLHNLILSQMYNDALKKQNKWKTNSLEQVNTDDNIDYFDKSNNDAWSDSEYHENQQNFDDDKNEDALKTLENYQAKHSHDIKRLRKYTDDKSDKTQKSTLSMDPNDTNMWINWYNKRNLNTEKINKKQETLNHGLWSPIHKKLTFSDRKNTHISQTTMPNEISQTTQNPITSTITSSNVPITSNNLKLNVANNKKNGQKEFVLLRPATPVRHPFTEPILELLAQQTNQNDLNIKRSPSVYNTIKQLLNMEDNIKEDEVAFNHNSNHKNLKKRYVTSENTLVNELKELKKTSY